ncbi:HK97 family phage major capsid protein [Nocardiopsis mwathae]|uniref:HK97 family phage major capsid protein n=1 Tax=Nocardiopsis mwathae TaxID=1472723 RepID=A0A7W9YHF3_9ACTN|nr:phage major capsid protein [Nocardiopsis mwathae]MBB6172183.1 HK97 family phage major capsid protein [Nocardiopsis mwathae]
MAHTHTLDDLEGQLKASLKAASDIADAAEHAGRDMTEDERAAAHQHLAKARDVAQQVKARRGDNALREAIKDLEGVGYSPSNGGQRPPRGGKSADLGGKSLGEHFVDSAEFQEMLASKSGAHFGTQQRINSRPVGYKDLLLTGSDRSSAGGFVRPDYRGLQLGLDPFMRPLTMRELVASATTTSDTVEYTYIDAVSLNARFVAESQQVETPKEAGPNTGVKPLSGFTTRQSSTGVKTIAHWFAMTRRAISDAAQVRTLVDALLRYGLEDEIDRQIISGDDSGSENLRGIANTDGVQVLNVDPGKGDPVRSNIEAIRRAKTMARLGARARANGIVGNPLDLEAMDLIKDNEGRYVLGGPVAAGGTGTLWNLPVVENEAVPQGQLFVGDWQKAILYDREDASITVTDSHADFFVRNMVAILAECRVAFAVIQPSAFVKVELAA